MSVAELKERHVAATATVNSLRDRLKEKRLLLLDTDISTYARSHGRTPVTFGPTDLICCRTLQGHTGKVYSLDWTPERNRIVSASQDGRLIVWNALTSQKTHAIKLPCAWVMTCAFSPNGQSVACGGLDSVCSIFNLNSPADRDGNQPISKTLSGHKGYVSCCQYVPDEETRLITSSGDQTCVLWDVTTGQRISVFGGEFPSGHTADVVRYLQRTCTFLLMFLEIKCTFLGHIVILGNQFNLLQRRPPTARSNNIHHVIQFNLTRRRPPAAHCMDSPNLLGLCCVLLKYKRFFIFPSNFFSCQFCPAYFLVTFYFNKFLCTNGCYI